MPKINAPLYSLNGGEVDEEALGRLDLERMRFAGSTYSNFIPRIIGSAMMRPGLEMTTEVSQVPSVMQRYVFSGSDTYRPIFSDQEIRIIRNGAVIERAAVSTTIADGDFASFAGWTDASTGAASASVSGGQLVLTGKQFQTASANQTVSIDVADQAVLQAIRVKVARGPVTISVGTTSGGDDLVSDAVLEDGDHSLAFTPNAASIYLRLFTQENRIALVDSCQIDAAGELVLESPYLAADLRNLRHQQATDVTFIAGAVYQQRELVRYGSTSWGLQRYKVNDGPFRFYDGEINMTPSVYDGNGTLSATQDYFKPSMVGRLFRLTQSGQTVINDFTAGGQDGDSVRISGVGEDRRISWVISGTFTATMTLEVANDDGSGNPTSWTTVFTRTTFGNGSYLDTDDNVIKFFRWSLKVGEHTSGTIEATIIYQGGSQDGVCRMSGYTSPTLAQIEVLDRFYSLNSTAQWDYSEWSDFDGWPQSVVEFGGRLYWDKSGSTFGTLPDDFYSLDDTVIGDSAPILRSLNSEGQSGAYWIMGLQRLIAGTDVAVKSIRSSSFDEPITADSWFPLDAATTGCADIPAIKTDTDGIFVASDGVTLHRLNWEIGAQDYQGSNLMALHEEICEGSPIVAMDIQRTPNTIVWIVLEDGRCISLTYEPGESVVAWSRMETDGLVRDVTVQKEPGGDVVSFLIERNGTQFLEEMAQYRTCRSATDNCNADSFVRFDGAATSTFSVPHLDGRDVTVWADGAVIHDQDNLYTVSGGQVVLASPASRVVIGLPYQANLVTTKLAYGAALGTALFQVKRVAYLGLLFVKSILDGIRVGPDANSMVRYTTTKDDAPLVAGTFYDEFDGPLESFGGDWDTDSRVHVQAFSPYPCTISGLVMSVKTNDTG